MSNTFIESGRFFLHKLFLKDKHNNIIDLYDWDFTLDEKRTIIKYMNSLTTEEISKMQIHEKVGKYNL